MKIPRPILILSLLALLGLACACPSAGLLQRPGIPTLPPLPTRTRAAFTATGAATAAASVTPGTGMILPTRVAPPTQTPAATLPPPGQTPEDDPGGDTVYTAAQLAGRYRESWISCDPPMQDWREGLVFELTVSGEEELLVREIPDAGNMYDPVVYLPGYSLDFFVYGGEAHPDRFIYYTFDALAQDRLQGWLMEDAGGYCQIVWTRL